MAALRATWTLALVALCSSCYYTLTRVPAVPDVRLKREGQDLAYFDLLAQAPLDQGVALAPLAEVAARQRPHAPPGELAGTALRRAALDAPVVLRFGLLADVHVREPDLKVFNRRESRLLDHVIPSLERHPMQEAFLPAYYMAVIRSLNQLPLRLVVHLGDAADVGTLAELYQFLYISRSLRMPLLNAIGNHDVGVFGNRSRLLVGPSGPHPAPGVHLIGDTTSFLYMHNRADRPPPDLAWRFLVRPPVPPRVGPRDPLARPDCEGGAAASESADTVQPRSAGEGARPGTQCLGFDLGPSLPGAKLTEACEQHPGYYSQVVRSCEGGRVQLLVLASAGSDRWAWQAELGERQLRFVAAQAAAPADVTLVFMHHPIADSPPLLRLLRTLSRRRPVVAFTAHLHQHHLFWRNGFWEVNTGSIMEFPQLARMIELRRGPGGYYLIARTLGPDLGLPPPRSVGRWDRRELAQQLAACQRLSEVRSFAEVPGGLAASGLPGSLLSASARCGHLGAIHDHIVDPTPKRSKQKIDEALREANFAIAVTGGQ